MKKGYWATSLDGIEKIFVSSFLPILYWSGHLGFALSIENKLCLPEQLRPIFMTAVLIAVPGALIYPLMRMAFRRCKFEISFSRSSVNLPLKKHEPKPITMTVKVCELPWLGWLLVRQFRLTFNLIASADIVLVKCPDRKAELEYTEMSDEGKLRVDFTKGVRSSGEDTVIEIPVILQPQSNKGNVKLLVEGRGGFLFRMLVHVDVSQMQVRVG